MLKAIIFKDNDVSIVAGCTYFIVSRASCKAHIIDQLFAISNICPELQIDKSSMLIIVVHNIQVLGARDYQRFVYVLFTCISINDFEEGSTYLSPLKWGNFVSIIGKQRHTIIVD
jgi:hypothetical protein